MTDIHDPFELVDSPWGHIEAWRASTLATGTMGVLTQVYDIVRNDAAAAVASVEETENRKELVQRLCDMVAALQDRINTLADALEARHRADEEEAQRQREFEEEPLTLPPHVVETDVPRDDHTPGGELHDLPASEPEDKEQQLSEPPEADDMGGVPLSYGNVPTSYVGGGPKDQVEFEEPEDDPEPEPKFEGQRVSAARGYST
jgi:hypothetical protein